LLLILLIYRFFRGFMSSIAVLIGLVVGSAVAAGFGMVDFTGVHNAGWIGVTTPFRFGAPTFGVAAIASMIIVMLITAVETTGDVFATGEIVQKTIKQEDIARGSPGRRIIDLARWNPEFFPLHLLCREHRAGAIDGRQKPFCGGFSGGYHDSSRALPQSGRASGCDSPVRPRRYGHHPLREWRWWAFKRFRALIFTKNVMS
jgi:hypothetical protein